MKVIRTPISKDKRQGETVVASGVKFHWSLHIARLLNENKRPSEKLWRFKAVASRYVCKEAEGYNEANKV